MIKKFSFWLESIVEDEPIPNEINIIVFKLNQNGKYYFLELFGLEKQLNINKMAYRPLEAQFFCLKDLFLTNNSVMLYKLKNLIDTAFENCFLKEQFKNKKIYFFYKNFEFLFCV